MPSDKTTTSTGIHRTARTAAHRPAVDAGHAGSHLPMRRPWTPPAMEALPRLTELTLQSPIGPGIGGGGGSGGSTVF